MNAIDQLKADIRRNASDLVRLFRVTKYELDALTSHVAGRVTRAIKPLGTVNDLKLNVASGGHRVPGWVHLDGLVGADIRADLRRRWPLPAGCAKLLYCEHFLDHLDYPHGAQKFAEECARVLAPGGRIRLVVHDLELIARAYLARDKKFFDDSGFPGMTFAESVNQVARFNDFHRFMYDFDTVSLLLRGSGFIEVERSSFRGSTVPDLNIDIDLPDREVQSLYVEARKRSE